MGPGVDSVGRLSRATKTGVSVGRVVYSVFIATPLTRTVAPCEADTGADADSRTTISNFLPLGLTDNGSIITPFIGALTHECRHNAEWLGNNSAGVRKSPNCSLESHNIDLTVFVFAKR